PKGYSGDGKEIGQAKKVSLGDRKYQNYDVSYAKTGSQYRKKTKYTNIDGSLNEKGKLHAQKYISKQIEKNEKYYAKEIAKYEKKAEKYKDNPEMHKKFLDMAKDAARSRDGVNKSIKEMAIDEIMTNESIENQKVMKAIKTAAGITVGAATGGAVLGAGLGIANGIKGTEQEAQIRADLKTAYNTFDIKRPVDSLMDISNKTSLGKQAENLVESTIRTYSDARAYVLGIGLDQAMYRMNAMGIPQQVGRTLGAGGKATLNEMGFTPQTITDLNSLVTNTGQVTNSILNNPNTSKTINQVLNNPQVASTFVNLNSAIAQSGGNTATVNVPSSVSVDPVIVDTINNIMGGSSSAANTASSSIPRQGDITKRPMNSSVPVSQQRKKK
ncbi:MAG: hypothetical protein J6Y15_09265, partial [Bacteroidaceae bacterium]|nr:hypothetical protein [Bacteroidaceae bacterium]